MRERRKQGPSPEVQAIYRLLRADARMLEIESETYIFCGKEHHRLTRKAYKGLYEKGWIEQAQQYPGSGIREFAATSRARESVAFLESLRTGFVQLELLPDIKPAPAAIQQPPHFDDDAPAPSAGEEPSTTEEPAPTEPAEPAPETPKATEEKEPETTPAATIATAAAAAAVVIPHACQVSLFAPAETSEPAASQEEKPNEQEHTSPASQPQAPTPEPMNALAQEEASEQKPSEEETTEPTPTPDLNFLETVRIDRYSTENQRLIRRRMPHATYVATYKTWQENGYQVRRGEHGVSIRTPRGGDQESGKTRFKARYVFDITQCDPIIADDDDEQEQEENAPQEQQPSRAEEPSRPTRQPQAPIQTHAPEQASVFREMAKLLA